MAARSRLKNDHSERTMGTPQAHSLGPPSSASSRVPIVQAPLLQSPCHNPGHQGHLESHSPSLAVGPQTRDSGYNTDVSPATTSSPATNANTRQHFVFDNLSHVTESSAHCSYPSAAGTPVPFSSPRSPRIHVLCDPRTRKKGTPPLRLSPEIFKIAEQKCSPKPVSETSETHVAVFDFEIDDNVPEKHDDLGHLEGAESADDLDLTEPRLPGGNAIDENLLYNPDGILRNWGQNPEYTTRGRASSFCSRPRRRHCSTGDNNFAETQEWCDEVAEVGSFSQRSFSFSETFSNNIPYGSVGHPDSIDLGVIGLQRRSRLSQLYSSQGFQSGCHDNSVSRSDSCDSENVFNFDLDDEQEDAPTDKAPHRSSQGVPIVREKPPHSPASTSRLHRRRVGIASSHLVTSSGVRLPHSGTILGVSVATQTPHAASALIQQLLSTPVPLPNESIVTPRYEASTVVSLDQSTVTWESSLSSESIRSCTAACVRCIKTRAFRAPHGCVQLGTDTASSG
ncbi:hypothetical protein BgiMline_009656 [Biomphalaria glabrata]|nr:hypothetical protein BgiMline_023776 [Biomphalaria glabrata]